MFGWFLVLFNFAVANILNFTNLKVHKPEVFKNSSLESCVDVEN